MKKTLCSALAAAFALGASATTFAAANPFTDVPADHWAYDAVAQLAADGVVDGYGDGTYRGQQEITRYEMAQMVARAMAKNPAGADKALVDKLAAEFADELNSLGVRVSALEKKMDNVQWYGLLRYTYSRGRTEGEPHSGNTNDFRLRLQMRAQVNEHWTGNARVEYLTNMKTAANATGANDDVFLNRVYAEGKYGKWTIDLGRFPYFTDVDGGMIFDDEFSGGMLTYGDKATVKIMVGRYHDNYSDNPLSANNGHITTASYQGIEFNSDPAQKFTYGAAYHHFATNDLKTNTLGRHGATAKKYNDDALNIWEVGLGYRFDKNFGIKGAYAEDTKGDSAKQLRRAWTAELDYKGANPKDRGSWGAYAAYRHLGDYVSVFPTYNAIFTGQKGVQLGVQYTILPNVLTTFEYFDGKDIVSNKDQDTIFARAEIFF